MDSARIDRVTIDILTGTVLHGKRSVRFTVTEFEVLAALGLCGPLDASAVCGMRWSGRDTRPTRRSLLLVVHRIRQRLGEDIILSSLGEYRLRGDVGIDLETIARRVREGACRIDVLTWAESERLIDDAAKLLAPRPAITAHWNWFPAVDASFMRLGSDVLHLMAEKLVRGDRAQEALWVSRIAIAADACDETAHETAMLALGALECPAAAMAEYRRYTRALAAEYGTQPSDRLRECYATVLPRASVVHLERTAAANDVRLASAARMPASRPYLRLPIELA